MIGLLLEIAAPVGHVMARSNDGRAVQDGTKSYRIQVRMNRGKGYTAYWEILAGACRLRLPCWDDNENGEQRHAKRA